MGRRLGFCSILLMLACDLSSTSVGPFSGIWAGGTADFAVSLSLTQTADTVRGALQLTRRSDSFAIVSPPLTLALRGDSVVFAFTPASASGYARISFRSQRRGDRMDAEFATDSTVSAVELDRQ